LFKPNLTLEIEFKYGLNCSEYCFSFYPMIKFIVEFKFSTSITVNYQRSGILKILPRFKFYIFLEYYLIISINKALIFLTLLVSNTHYGKASRRFIYTILNIDIKIIRILVELQRRVIPCTIFADYSLQYTF